MAKKITAWSRDEKSQIEEQVYHRLDVHLRCSIRVAHLKLKNKQTKKLMNLSSICPQMNSTEFHNCDQQPYNGITELDLWIELVQFGLNGPT